MNNKTLKEISVNDISPNPQNPRLFFDEDDLLDLKESISRVGVLVPITVYENTREKHLSKYILLDGERRWRSTKDLGLGTIKANIIDEPEDVTQNILYMFNIHYYKKEWELFPTALKLEVLINKLGTSKETVLASSTGLKPQMIRYCKKLLWYPKKYRNILMDRDPKISTGFFIELYPIAFRLSSEPDFSTQSELENFIDTIIEKFKNGTSFSDVKQLREIRRFISYYDQKGNSREIVNRMKMFMRSISQPIEIFEIADIDIQRQRESLLKQIALLNSILTDIDPEILSDVVFVEQFITLQLNLKKVIEKID